MTVCCREREMVVLRTGFPNGKAYSSLFHRSSSSNCRSNLGSSTTPMANMRLCFLINYSRAAVPALLATAVIFSSAANPSPETLSNVPQTLSGEDGKQARIQRPRSRKAESCTIKCVTTCIRGGAGSPGEGPFNVRRPLVVFKEGFRSRHYCLVECSDICNLIKDGEDGP